MEESMKADRQAPFGVFDSGVGGLTVVREIMRNLPDERIVYFGDTARVPYGSKSRNTVIRYSRQIVHFLETQQVKAIVIACKLLFIFGLWYLFFSPEHRPTVTPASVGAAILGEEVSPQQSQSTDTHIRSPQ